MNYRYDGISADSLALLSENRFRNSKPFYEEHKQQLKNGIIVPLRQITAALMPTINEIDAEICVVPEKSVARIRRDNRYTKDKTLYRENIWTMFTRDKHALPYYPCMWFEVSPYGYSGGVGTYYAPPAMMEIYRRELLNASTEFSDIVDSLAKAGLMPHLECYRKEKPGSPSTSLKPFYNAKSLYFSFDSPEIKRLEHPDFVESIRPYYYASKDFYMFMQKISAKYDSVSI